MHDNFFKIVEKNQNGEKIFKKTGQNIQENMTGKNNGKKIAEN